MIPFFNMEMDFWGEREKKTDENLYLKKNFKLRFSRFNCIYSTHSCNIDRQQTEPMTIFYTCIEQ